MRKDMRRGNLTKPVKYLKEFEEFVLLEDITYKVD